MHVHTIKPIPGKSKPNCPASTPVDVIPVTHYGTRVYDRTPTLPARQTIPP